MNTIQEQWSTFLAQVVPKDAADIQINEMRLAFYAGVTAMMHIEDVISNEKVSVNAAIAILEGVHDECHRFVSDVASGKA